MQSSQNNNVTVTSEVSNGEGRKPLTPADCTSIMTDLVTMASEDQILYISVGAGDFHARWFPDLYNSTNRVPHTRPRIKRVVIKRIDPVVMEKYEERGWLEPSLGKNLSHNLEIVSALCKAENIDVDICYWHDLPPFHGFLFGDDLLMGRWEFNGKYFQHRTLLSRYTRQSDPIEYETYLYSMSFDEPSPFSSSKNAL